MKTKLVSLFVALFASTALWAYDFKSGDLYYSLNNDEVEVVRQTDYAGLTSIIIPSSVTHDGTTYRVTSIGWWAFFDCTGLTSITIPNSVTSIGNWAFYNVLNIIYYGTATGSPWGAKNMNGYADGYLVYEDDTKTKLLACSTAATGEIVIPNSVTSIGDSAFYSCTGLTSITIPNSVTSIGEAAFSGCTGLTSITIPNSVTSIGDMAFYGCTGLTSVAIPNSVTSIGDDAFSGCTGLTSITIPNSVTSIGNRAFEDTPWLENQSGLIYIGNVLYAYKGEMPENTSIVVKDGVTSIVGPAFSGCTGLTSVTIPNSVTSIGGGAFDGCTGLTSITIPNSVTSIDDGVFYGCTGLTSITIPNSVTSIGDMVFSDCTGLTSVVINNNNLEIGGYEIDGNVFSGCQNLTRVTCYADVPPIVYSAGLTMSSESELSGITLYVPAKAVDKYKEADFWKGFASIVPIGATATDTDEPVIMPSYTEVTIAWPTAIGAKTYTITITQDGKTISSLTFDDTGLLINAAFAVPSYNGNARQAPAAQYTQSAFWFTFSGLECNTQYDYSIVAQSSNGQPISTYNGTFRTTAPTAIDNVLSDENSDNAATHTRKIFRNGQVLIQHNGKTYTISGNEVK